VNVLIGCEYTGTGQVAFEAAGHNAWSCDLDPTEGNPARHLQCDIFEALNYMKWDLIILHPDCTRMAVCGNGTYAGTPGRDQDVGWTLRLFHEAKKRARRVCLENPSSVLFTYIKAVVQYIQPWEFGHPETKRTGLALHNLEPLKGTKNVYDHMMTLPPKERHKVWYASPSETRGKDRSRSYPGILRAMAQQWITDQTGQ
jgi:hypothetical protein